MPPYEPVSGAQAAAHVDTEVSTTRPTVGYVMKVYPRFSETFILNEILAHEAAGQPLELFSLRAPTDGRFHEALAEVAAPVTYLPGHPVKTTELWRFLAEATELDLAAALDELLAVGPDEACAAIALARRVRERGIAHLHAHFGTSATTVARLAARLAGIGYSFTAHAKDIFHDSVVPADLRAKLRDAAATITVSDFNLAHLHETFGRDAARVRRVYNGLDLTRFPYQRPDGRPPLIAAVGRLVEKKGFDVLVRACALLRESGTDFRCQIVGSGEQEAALRALVERLGVADRVELLGPRPQGRVRALVQSAAVLAAPCVVGDDGNRDGLPTVLLEAMALGTACVSTDVTGIPEIVHDGETGLCVPQHDAIALADAMARLLADTALQQRLADKARAVVEADFDVLGQTARLREVFTTAIHDQREPA